MGELTPYEVLSPTCQRKNGSLWHHKGLISWIVKRATAKAALFSFQECLPSAKRRTRVRKHWLSGRCKILDVKQAQPNMNCCGQNGMRQNKADRILSNFYHVESEKGQTGPRTSCSMTQKPPIKKKQRLDKVLNYCIICLHINSWLVTAADRHATHSSVSETQLPDLQSLDYWTKSWLLPDNKPLHSNTTVIRSFFNTDPTHQTLA